MPAEVHIGCCGRSYPREQEFFDAIDRGGFLLAWEPRGMWNENPQAIIDVCEDLRLAHCVDPLRNLPLTFAHLLAGSA